MLAGILAASGWDTGEDYIPRREANPKGFYEDRAVNAINDAMLRSVVPARPRRLPARLFPGRRNAGLWAVALDRKEVRSTPDLDAAIAQLVARRPFAYKDPRFCWTLPAWAPQLPAGTVRLCVFREPGRTAASIVKEFGQARYLRGEHMTHRSALRVWTAMYERVLELSRDDPDWVFVHYEQVLDGSAVPSLERRLDGSLDTSLVDPSLKRSPDHTGRLPSRTRRTYGELCRVAGVTPS